MYTIKIVQKQREENKRIANLKKIANSLLIGIALRPPSILFVKQQLN